MVDKDTFTVCVCVASLWEKSFLHSLTTAQGLFITLRKLHSSYCIMMLLSVQLSAGRMSQDYHTAFDISFWIHLKMKLYLDFSLKCAVFPLWL